LAKLRPHLHPLDDDGELDLWDDSRIEPGLDWLEEIQAALANARVAILLVSADFLASDFIRGTELPSLLSNARQHDCLVLPLILRPCRFSDIPTLQQFQALNSPQRPLSRMNRSDVEEFLVRTAKLVFDHLQRPSRRRPPIVPPTIPGEAEPPGTPPRPKAMQRAGEPPHPFWGSHLIDSSRLHERSSTGDPTVLVILVHDAGGHAVKTWGGVPRRLIEAIGADADVISYANPASLSRPASVGEAAVRLRQLILNRPQPYMHLFFLVHDGGGVVVGELLAQDVESVARAGSDVLAQLPAIAAKVRAVFDLSVTPCGAGQPQPAARGDDFGGTRLARRLRRSLQLMEMNDFPRPRLVAFAPLDDSRPGLAALAQGYELAESITGCEEEKSASSSSWRSGARLGQVAARMRPYLNSPDMVMSYCLLRRVVGLDRGIRPTSGSLEQLSDEERLAYSDWAGCHETQEFVLVRLAALSDVLQVRDHPRIVITGSVGVGKSVVLRRHARYVATRYLEQRPGAQLCVFIPMQNVTLDARQLESMAPAGTPTAAWRVLSQDWAKIALDVLLDPQEESAFGNVTAARKVDAWEGVRAYFTESWNEGRVLDGQAKIILDGVDEFLVNHSSLTLATIRELLRFFEQSPQSPRIQCLLAVSNALPGAAKLSRHSVDAFEICTLSASVAEAMFPGAEDLLKVISDTRLRRLILSPLVLVRLGPTAASLRQGSLDTRAAILRRALEAVIEQSALRFDEGAGSPVGAWLQALALTAWMLYRDSRGFITVSEMRSLLQDLKAVWARGVRPMSHCFAEGIAVLEDDSALNALRARTVLDSLGRDAVRFAHREWQDFLVADYLAECALGQVFEELDRRAFAKQIYIDAANVLWGEMTRLGERIGPQWLDGVLAGDDPSVKPYVLMSVCALLGNGPVNMDQSAFTRLMKSICDVRCPEVARLVAVSSFCMRVLRNDARDLSINFMVGDLVAVLNEIVRQGVGHNRKVSASLAWCYRAEVRRQYGGLVTGGSEAWPALSAVSETGVAAAGASSIVWRQGHEAEPLDPRCRSFQVAAAQYPLAVRDFPNEEISLTHYLFLAAAAVRAGVATSEIFPLLKAVFAPESGIAARIDQFPLTEVQELFASCRAATQDLLSPTGRIVNPARYLASEDGVAAP
jgi:hypothetical protein